MTPEEFNKKVAKALADVPKAFHRYFLYHAEEDGHSGGYSEVYNCLVGQLDYFEKALNEYKETVRPSHVFLVERSTAKGLTPLAVCSTDKNAMTALGRAKGIITRMEVDIVYEAGLGLCDHEHIHEEDENEEG